VINDDQKVILIPPAVILFLLPFNSIQFFFFFAFSLHEMEFHFANQTPFSISVPLLVLLSSFLIIIIDSLSCSP